ncbi:MAG: DegT/DnrJ/EryC1/StrS family aminotransferase [Parcubacteria group bacterium]|nr:DegT/DnrJ/EryC1/StrS family aminotransferase [Parcubacteria group bacterium]
MIRVCEPDITSREIRYVMDAIKTGQISGMAKYVGLFEKAFAKKTDVKYAVAVNSGASALFLALWALGIRKGDEVIVPAFTMAASANAVVQCGAKPVFVDSEDNGNIDVTKIEKKITKRTKAIMPVHIYGHPCHMDEIKRIAKKYKLYIVEDAAEAQGASYKGKVVGAWSDAACFSFYANKLVTTGEGGMVATNDKKLADELSKFRDHYWSGKGKNRYFHKKPAWNMKLSSLLAALGLAQLERLDELINKRRANAKYYTKGLQTLRDRLIFPTEKKGVRSVFWMYGLVVKEKGKRDKLIDYLAKNNIESRAFFIPMNLQPAHKQKGSFPVSEYLGANGLYIPSSSHLSKKDKDRVIVVIKEFFLKSADKNADYVRRSRRISKKGSATNQRSNQR